MEYLFLRRVLLSLILLVAIETTSSAWSINPLTWGTYKAKVNVEVSPAALKRVDVLNARLREMNKTINDLPLETRRALEPLLNKTLSGMQSLVDKAGDKMLGIVETAIMELDVALQQNINLVDDVLEKNINLIDDVLEKNINLVDDVLEKNILKMGESVQEGVDYGATRAEEVIVTAINRSDAAAKDVIEHFVQTAEMAFERKALLLDHLYQKRGEEFYLALQQSMQGFDQILSGRIAQAGAELREVIQLGANVADSVLKEATDRFFEKGEHLYDKIRQGNQQTITEASEAVHSATVGFTKAGIIGLLALLGYKLALRSTTGSLVFSQNSKILLATLIPLALALVLFDAPLKNALRGQEKETYAQAMENIQNFYAEFDPKIGNQRYEELIEGLVEILSAPDAVLTPAQKRTITQHLGFISSEAQLAFNN